jgi:hypothetical protein
MAAILAEDITGMQLQHQHYLLEVSQFHAQTECQEITEWLETNLSE